MVRELNLLVLGYLVLFGALCCSAQTTTECTPSCQNNGTCTQDLNSSSYSCNCTGTGFEGATCSTSTTSGATPPTASNSSCPVACQNGTCTPEIDSGGYYCACNSGFTGIACSVSSGQSPTAGAVATSCPADCQNGRCEAQMNSDSYHCVCNSGYTGVSCATRTAPSMSTADCPVACYNGFCTQTTNGLDYFCECYPGYSGASCTAPSPMASPAPNATSASGGGGSSQCPLACVHGSCGQQFNSVAYECQCSSGWRGAACDMAAGPAAAEAGVAGTAAQDSGRSSTGSLKGWEVFVIVLAVVVGVVLIGSIGLIVWKKRSRRATFVKFNDSFEPQQVEVLGGQPSHGSHTQV